MSGRFSGHARLSRRGLIAYASSTDCVGPIASTVIDAAALLGVVAGEDHVGDSTGLHEAVPDYVAILREVRFELFGAGTDVSRG